MSPRVRVKKTLNFTKNILKYNKATVYKFKDEIFFKFIDILKFLFRFNLKFVN